MSDGWHPDPTGRHEQRYFDGTAWTDYVADRGMTWQENSATAEPQPGSPKRLILIGGIAFAVVMALILGAVAVRNTVGVRGADSPEEAVHTFVRSLTDLDLVGAARMVNPAEVEGLQDVYTAARTRLKEASVDDGVASMLDGDPGGRPVQIKLTNLKLKTHALGERYRWVSLQGGSYTVKWDPSTLTGEAAKFADTLPARTWSGDYDDILADLFGHPDNIGSEERRLMEAGYLGIPTVKVNGRWYVSLLGAAMGIPGWWAPLNPAVAEVHGPGAGLTADYTAEPEQPIVGDTPEAAIANLAVTNPSELLRAVPADQTLWALPYLKSWSRFINERVDLGLTLSGLDTEIEPLGHGTKKVIVTDATLQASYDERDGGDSDYINAELHGSCLSADDGSGACLRDIPLGLNEFFLVVRRVSGGYQVDPIATAIEYGHQMVEGASPDLIREGYRELLVNLCWEFDRSDQCDVISR